VKPDGHNDLAILIRVLYNNHIYDDNFTEPFVKGGMPSHVDLPRLRAGQNGGAFWSVFTPCPADGQDYSDENYAASESSLSFHKFQLAPRLTERI
jgi:membrane dipeptidase